MQIYAEVTRYSGLDLFNISNTLILLLHIPVVFCTSALMMKLDKERQTDKKMIDSLR